MDTLRGSDRFDGSSEASFVRLNVHDRLVEYLAYMIVGGEIAPGERLPREADLMAELGVSRSTVREAVRVLTAKGLVMSRQNVGSVVRSRPSWHVLDPDVIRWMTARNLSDDILKDVTELRQMFEPIVARLVAQTATPDDVKNLRGFAQAMCDNTHDIEVYNAADVDFHVCMFNATRNLIIIRIGELVKNLLNFTLRLQNQVSLDLKACAEQHLDVVEAIANGDGDHAERSMRVIIAIGASEVERLLPPGYPSAQ